MDPIGTERVTVRNPADGSVIGTAAMGNAEDADRAVAAARAAFDGWSRTGVEERLALLRRMRAAFDEAAPAIAAHLVREVGLTTMVAEGQSAMCRSHFDGIFDLLPSYPFSASDGGMVELAKEPVGVVVAITSWNAPVSQMLCKAVPAIAAGCTVVVKPSEQAPLCGMLLAQAMDKAGIPPGVFNLLNGRGGDCGRRLAEHPDVDMVSMTGSVPGGGAMAAAAAPTIKRVHQELGGKSANVILPDADMAEAVRKSVFGCMMNAGQTCAAPTRLIVPEDRFQEIAALAVAAAEALVVGPPDAPGVTYGPLSNQAQFDRVNAMLERAIAEGLPLLTGGPGRPEHLSTGFYARPTVFGPVPVESFLAQEEVFGPVLSIQTYTDEEDAIRIANATPFGLAAYVQSADPAAARRVAGRLRAGYVTINFPPWTAAAPFGGYRRSGNGKQYGVWGFEEFLETKAIVRA
ncbi:aldehyde dehydrogenase family protein [Sphingomonas canadensis]|uniref:aldehyde dehydrogenase family protein n=1 Tax=Sphingomonas canadensis TaxID=1219257 RepID=UPI002231B3E1|nr:aldehyde dehydrogenase family protein [Sphingomonas canadensis]